MPDKDRALVEERIKRSGAVPGQGHQRVPTSANKRTSGARIVVPEKCEQNSILSKEQINK